MFHQLLPNALSEIFMQAMTSQQLTLADRYGLAAAICNALIEEEEKRAIDRLLYAVRRGQIKIVADLSVLQLQQATPLNVSLHPNCFNIHKFVNSVNPQLSAKTRSLGASKG
jgi:hypothetical protein